MAHCFHQWYAEIKFQNKTPTQVTEKELKKKKGKKGSAITTHQFNHHIYQLFSPSLKI